MNRTSSASLGSFLLLGASSLLAANCASPADGAGTIGAASAAIHAGPAITVTIAAAGHDPVDTAPDEEGRTFYFIGSHGRDPGLFRVSASGKGAPVDNVRSGAPLVTPRSITTSSDEDRLYVADTGADAIFAIGAHSGRVEQTIAAGSHPRGVEVAGTCDDDPRLYYTGTDARSGKPGLFFVDERGVGKAILVGAPLSAPDAIAVSHRGVVYLSDTPGVAGAGRVIAIDPRRRGAATVLAQGLTLGDPAGVALTLDDNTLLVSGLDGHGHSQVYQIDTANGAIATFSGGGIAASTAAGGVHRAAKRNVFGWADRSRGGGTVYNIALSGRAYNAEP